MNACTSCWFIDFRIVLFGLYSAKDALTTLLLSAGYISISSITWTALVGSIVSLFPTSTRFASHLTRVNLFSHDYFFVNLCRTMNASRAMIFGRSGAIIGNLLFPLPMCPFVMAGATAISIILNDNKNFELMTQFLKRLCFSISLQLCLLYDPKNDPESSPVAS